MLQVVKKKQNVTSTWSHLLENLSNFEKKRKDFDHVWRFLYYNTAEKTLDRVMQFIYFCSYS